MPDTKLHNESKNHSRVGKCGWSGIAGLFSLHDGLVCGGLSITLLVWQVFASLPLNVNLIAFDFLLPALALLTGRVPLIALKLPAGQGFSQAGSFVGGAVFLNLAMLAITFIFRLPAASSFMICAASIVLVSLGVLRFLPEDSIRKGTAQACCREDLPAFALLFIAATLWSQAVISALPEIQSSGTFPAWLDCFIHANTLVQLRDYSVLGGTSVFLSGTPMLFYHYGSYMLPAALSSLANQTALGVVVSFWIPLGFLLMGLGANAAGCALAGRKGGIAALTAVFLIPDASTYGMQNGFFGFHWMLQISAGSSYAVATAMIVFGLLKIASDARRVAPLLIATGLVAAIAALRAQLFIVMALAWIPLFLAAWRPRRQWLRLAAAMAIIFVGLIGVIGAEYIPLAPHFISGHNNAIEFFQLIDNLGSSYNGLFQKLSVGQGPSATKALGLAFLMFTAFGPLIPIYFGIIAFRLILRRGNMRIIDFFPAAVLVAYCLVILVFPASNTADNTEFLHRPFVLVYAVLAVWIGAWLAAFLWDQVDGVGQRALASSGLASILILLAVPWMLGPGIQVDPQPWAQRFPLTRIPAGLATGADFIRRNAKPGDIVLSSNLDPWSINAALTERPAFVSLSEPLKLSDHSKLLANRTDIFWAIRTSSEFGEISRIAKLNGIDWYLLRQGEEGFWTDSILSQAVFTQDGYFVFRFDRSGGQG
jgi:hypothetical protein